MSLPSPKKKLPIGIQTFRELREEGHYFVDKTGYALRLINEGKYYFLSRPRRFGKSLLLDTLAELFEGNRPLFEGLYANGGERPVLTFTADSYEHDAVGHDRLLNRVELDHRKADCREHQLSALSGNTRIGSLAQCQVARCTRSSVLMQFDQISLNTILIAARQCYGVPNLVAKTHCYSV